MLIIRDLASGPRRFVGLQRVLPGISTEQLRSRLNRMVGDELLTRERFREVPPRVEYGLTPKARELLPVIGALSRWGVRWSWAAPRDIDAIDIGAILRSMPGQRAPEELDAAVELAVVADGSQIIYTVGFRGGRCSVAEGGVGEVAARISGSEGDWVSALSPGGDESVLRISGDAGLGAVFLAAILPAARQIAPIA